MQVQSGTSWAPQRSVWTASPVARHPRYRIWPPTWGSERRFDLPRQQLRNERQDLRDLEPELLRERPLVPVVPPRRDPVLGDIDDGQRRDDGGVPRGWEVIERPLVRADVPALQRRSPVPGDDAVDLGVEVRERLDRSMYGFMSEFIMGDTSRVATWN